MGKVVVTVLLAVMLLAMGGAVFVATGGALSTGNGMAYSASVVPAGSEASMTWPFTPCPSNDPECVP